MAGAGCTETSSLGSKYQHFLTLLPYFCITKVKPGPYHEFRIGARLLIEHVFFVPKLSIVSHCAFMRNKFQYILIACLLLGCSFKVVQRLDGSMKMYFLDLASCLEGISLSAYLYFMTAFKHAACLKHA